MLCHQIFVKDLTYFLEELIEKHNMSKLHFEINSLHEKCKIRKVDHIWEVMSHRKFELKEVLGSNDFFLVHAACCTRLDYHSF